MKKFNILMFCLFFSLFAFSVSAKDYYWENISTHLYINEDGSVNVIESQSFVFNDKFTFAYRYFHFDKISSLSDIRVYENNNEIMNKEISDKNNIKPYSPYDVEFKFPRGIVPFSNIDLLVIFMQCLIIILIIIMPLSIF